MVCAGFAGWIISLDAPFETEFYILQLLLPRKSELINGMMKADIECTEISIQIHEAENSEYSLELFARVRDRLLRNDSRNSAMIYHLRHALNRKGHDLEHLGVDWHRFRSRARRIEKERLTNGLQTQSWQVAERRLKQIKFILDRWPRDVLRHYGWGSTGQSKIRELYNCSKEFPNFEQDFVPVANYVLMLKHRAAIQRSGSYERTIGFNPKQVFRTKDLPIISKLKNSLAPISKYGEVFTLQAALNSREEVQAWMTANEGSRRMIRELLEVPVKYSWRLFLLEKDRYGLLEAKNSLPRGRVA